MNKTERPKVGRPISNTPEQLLDRLVQAAVDEGQQQPDGSAEPDVQARQQLPPVESDFDDGPDDGDDQDQGQQAERRAASPEHQHARCGQAETGQQVVQRAAQAREIGAAAQQHDTQNNENRSGNSQ